MRPLPRYAPIADSVKQTLPRSCEQCAAQQRLEIHHVDVDPSNPDRSNLRVLCQPCHVALHVSMRARRDGPRSIRRSAAARHVGPQKWAAHNLSLDAETSGTLVRLVRERFNLPDDRELPRGVMSWFIVELIHEKAAKREMSAVAS